jgi:hypothetical protein
MPENNPDLIPIYIQEPLEAYDGPVFPKLLKISAFSPSAGVRLEPAVKILF